MSEQNAHQTQPQSYTPDCQGDREEQELLEAEVQAQKLFQVETLKEIWDGRADGVVHWRRFFGVSVLPRICGLSCAW